MIFSVFEHAWLVYYIAQMFSWLVFSILAACTLWYFLTERFDFLSSMKVLSCIVIAFKPVQRVTFSKKTTTYFWSENRKSLSKRKGIYAFNLSTKIFIQIARIKQWQVEPFTRPKQIFFLSFQQMSPFFQQDGSMTLPPAY